MFTPIRGLLPLYLATTTLAYAQTVVIGHPSAAAMTQAQVSEAYTGKGGSIVLFDLPEGNPMRASFYRQATGKEPGQIRALWARLAFTGKSLPPRELPDAVAARKAVAADPKALAYIDKDSVDSTVKVLLTIP
jgi:hypothetical protein